MAAQDLIISRRGSVSPSSYLEPDGSGADGPDGATILLTMLRKRWLLLVVIALASVGLAVVAGLQFSSSKAEIKSALIYTGLPASSLSQNQFQPLGPATGAEMIVSARVLNQLIDRRGLGLKPATLAASIDATAGRNSSLLDLSLTWPDPDDGVTILNELMKIFIEDMAAQRKAIQRDYLQHLDMSLLQAKAYVDDSHDRQNALRKQQQQQLDKGGQTSDQYRTLLNSIASTEAATSDKKTEQITTSQQIDALTQLITNVDKTQSEAEKSFKDDLLHETSDTIKAAQARYAPSSPVAHQLHETIARISQFAKSANSPKEIDRWQKDLQQLIQAKSTGLSADDVKALSDSLQRLQTEQGPKFHDIASQRQRLQDQRQQLQLKLIPLKNQIDMLESRKAAYNKQAQALSEQITGISASQIDQSAKEVDEAQKRVDSITVERDNLRQLAESRLREWTVSVPASSETTSVSSNRAKLFVLVFGFCSLIFSAPLLVAEWRTQSGSPQVRFARSLRVPVLAERVLEDFSPKQRQANAQARLLADKMETIRMLTLRIQQSCHNPGSVVLFSSLDSSFSAAPLMATVAECLADREERVLLVDAVSPDRALLPVLNVLPNADSARPTSGKHRERSEPEMPGADATRSSLPGLSEYLSEECEDVGDLIRPTGCPGVDLISSGQASFARSHGIELLDATDQYMPSELHGYSHTRPCSPQRRRSANVDSSRRRHRPGSHKSCQKRRKSASGGAGPPRAWGAYYWSGRLEAFLFGMNVSSLIFQTSGAS